MEKLAKHEGAVISDFNPHSNVLRSPSPSLNFAFGNGHGLPKGYSLVVWGPPKGGKTLVTNSFIGQMHQDDPEGYAIKFDAEVREQGQLTSEMKRIHNIDPSRYMCYSVNTPDLIYDYISKEVAAMCQEGLPLRLVAIDSMNAIRGRRSMAAKSIMVQQMGDQALTNKDGLKQILMTQRKYGFSLIMTAHVGAELDTLEQMRGNKVRMAQAYGVQHHAEYFMYVEQDRTKDGKTDLLGNLLVDEKLKDLDEREEKTGHKIRCVMKDATMGPKGRTGIFTFDYKRGVVNTHEEVFQLGVYRGIISRPNNKTYVYGDRQWVGQEAMLTAIRDEKPLSDAILTDLKVKDMAGAFRAQDVEDEKKNAEVLAGE
jgi:GTPase SAR1 family protein